MIAARLLLDRYWPHQRFARRMLLEGGRPADVGASIVAMAASGDVPLEDAQSLHKLVSDQAKLETLQELARRVEALEAGERQR